MNRQTEIFSGILARTRTVTFDCYGTLIDWGAGLHGVFVDVFGAAAVASRRRELFETYVRIEAEIESGSWRPYREVLAGVLDRLASSLGLRLPPDKRHRLAELLPNWTPFPDTNESLTRLKGRFRLGVLSNIDRDLFAGAARHFPVEFDFVVTAEDVRSYKPALSHFERCLAEHADQKSWLHVAQSLFHDGGPANRLGVAFAWINRYNDPVDAGVKTDAAFTDLRSLADAAGC